MTREQLAADDVTAAYVDADSRARNLRVARQRAEELMARAGDVREVLDVQRELTRITGQLEAQESRRQHLAGQVQLARITVRLWGSDGGAPPPAEPFVRWAVAEHAHRAVRNVAQCFVDGVALLVVLVIYAAPLCVAGFLLAPLAACVGPHVRAAAGRIARAMSPPRRGDQTRNGTTAATPAV